MKRLPGLAPLVAPLLAVTAAWAGNDCHFTILNKTAGKVTLAFWGATGWASSTDPVRLFTGAATSGTAEFDPYPAQQGEFNVGHARKGLNVSGEGRLFVKPYDAAFDPSYGRFELAADGDGDFVRVVPGYSVLDPLAILPEFFGNRKDLFAIVLDNQYFAWAGMLLHNAGNGDSEDAWTNTLRSLIYSYYYKYAYGEEFLFNPPGGGWYVHTGGGSDDLLWATLAAIGYKELSSNYNNGMPKDVYRHQYYYLKSYNDSNRGFCGEYITLADHRRCFVYLNDSGHYYGGKETPDSWYGIPWKDHSEGVTYFINYRSSLSDQRQSHEHDGLNFRASISNGLFWLYSARLLKHRDRLGLSAADVAALKRAVGDEYDLFFVNHKDRYVCHANDPEPDPAHPVDRIGLIRDGAHYPCRAYVDNPAIDPVWEQTGGDYNTWTYNSGVVLGCLGESYLAEPSPGNARKFLAANGLDLARAALDRLSWRTDGNAPAGVICEIENEVRGIEPNRDMIVFKGTLALFIGDFAEALHAAAVNGHLSGADLEGALQCYKRISGAIRGTSNFLASEWGLTPPAAWVWRDSPYLEAHPDRAGSNSVTGGSAAAAHVTAGRLLEWDKDFVKRGIIDDPDEYLIYETPW